MGDGIYEAELTNSLCKVILDPTQFDSLHEILGGFCHQCRNTLNALKLSLYLVTINASPEMSDFWKELETRYLAVEKIFDRLQTICRSMAFNPVRMPLRLLIEDRQAFWFEMLAAKGRRLELIPPLDERAGDFDPCRLGQGLDVFVAWRAEAGEPGQPLRLDWWAEDGQFHLQWYDPLDWGGGSKNGIYGRTDSLALPLLARIMISHSGTLGVAVDEGLYVRLHWPLNVRSLP